MIFRNKHKEILNEMFKEHGMILGVRFVVTRPTECYINYNNLFDYLKLSLITSENIHGACPLYMIKLWIGDVDEDVSIHFDTAASMFAKSPYYLVFRRAWDKLSTKNKTKATKMFIIGFIQGVKKP